MIYTKLAQSEIEISMMGLGCWALGAGAVWGEQDEQDSIDTVHAAIATGVNLFDTAPGYGKSEEVLGKAIKGKRNKVVIADKVSREKLSPQDVHKSCEQSLKLLATDHIDILQIHWPSLTIPLADTIGAMEELKQQGKIRAISVSNFGVGNLSKVLDITKIATNQVPYSLLFRAIEFAVQPKCAENNVGIFCYCPLMQGLLTDKYETLDQVPAARARTRHFSKTRPLAAHDEAGCEEETLKAIRAIRGICQRINQPMNKVALAWLVYQQSVSSVLVGARSPEQIIRNASAINIELSKETIAELNKQTEKLKIALGTNPDLWQSESRYR